MKIIKSSMMKHDTIISIIKKERRGNLWLSLRASPRLAWQSLSLSHKFGRVFTERCPNILFAAFL
jgi:hypothetical protein